MTDQPVTSADLNDLARQADAAARTRNLVVLPAMMRTDPDVVLEHPLVSIDQALDVAQEVKAPFVAIDVIPFDAAAFFVDEVIEVGEDHDIPGDLLVDAADHEGEPESIWVRWVSAGTAYAFLATATWYEELSARLDSWVQSIDDE